MSLFLWANVVLALHGVYVLAISIPIPLIIIGGFRHWGWVRVRTFRRVHVGMIGVVALEQLIHVTCPLTHLEVWLRGPQADAAVEGSWFAYWVGRFLYHDWPNWVFTGLYLGTAVLLVGLYFLIPPVPQRPVE